jgi:hypothetical protein
LFGRRFVEKFTRDRNATTSALPAPNPKATQHIEWIFICRNGQAVFERNVDLKIIHIFYDKANKCCSCFVSMDSFKSSFKYNASSINDNRNEKLTLVIILCPMVYSELRKIIFLALSFSGRFL